jgi:hypothetical protein
MDYNMLWSMALERASSHSTKPKRAQGQGLNPYLNPYSSAEPTFQARLSASSPHGEPQRGDRACVAFTRSKRACGTYSLHARPRPLPLPAVGRIADCDADRGFDDGRELMLAGLSAKTCAADCRARWNS